MKKFLIIIFSTFLLMTFNLVNAIGLSGLQGGINVDSRYNNTIYNDSSEFSGMIYGLIYIIFILILLYPIIKNIIFSKGKINNYLVLTKFDINNDNNNDVVLIESRKGGLINLILKKININNQITFKINKKNKNISLEYNGIEGKMKNSVDFKNISLIKVGSDIKIFTTLILAILTLVTLSESISVGIVMLILTIYYYFSNKLTILEFETNGGSKIGLSFSKSIIENNEINIKDIYEIENIINDLKK